MPQRGIFAGAGFYQILLGERNCDSQFLFRGVGFLGLFFTVIRVGRNSVIFGQSLGDF